MPYIPGVLSIERVIRPNAVEELLCLKPTSGAKAIVFDLEESLQRSGLCDFIKECDEAKCSLNLESNGAIHIPPAMEKRFEYFREFYGLTRWALLNVEILQTGEKKKTEKKEDKQSSEEGTATMKKLDVEPPPAVIKKKPKTFKKLEARPLNIVPASIVWVASGPAAPSGPKKNEPTGPVPLSSRFGMQKVGMSSVGLGKPASGLKSLGGMGGGMR